MSKPVILVVDDDAPILVLMRSLLREFGFESATASSGEQAVEAAKEKPPALVLLDKNMPGMSARDVVQTLRAMPGLEKLPILILSGEPIVRQELTNLGADGAILKPFDVPALIAQIRERVATAP